MQLLFDKIPTDASDWRLDALVSGDGSVVRNQLPANPGEIETA